MYSSPDAERLRAYQRHIDLLEKTRNDWEGTIFVIGAIFGFALGVVTFLIVDYYI